MKSIRIALPLVVLSLVTVTFSQTNAAVAGPAAVSPKPAAAAAPDTASPKAEARKTFKQLKLLVGSWESDNPKQPLTVKFRVTSNGSAILSEMEAPPDNMVTMYHLDDDRLMMTHYCAAGNQPRMVGKMSPDGKTLEFDFLDGTNFNSRPDGHMHGMRLTMIDENHHSEDLIFQAKDGSKMVPVHFNMHRTQ